MNGITFYLNCSIREWMNISLMALRANSILHSATIMFLINLILGANIIGWAFIAGVTVNTSFGTTREWDSE